MKTKKKGLIRTEAIIPVVILLILIVAYFRFFFDSHLRSGLEWGASYVHGAEVNIGSIHSSVLDLFIEIEDVQVTDKNQPSRNIVSVGTIRFHLLPDAILRAKGVIEEASILNIQAFSPRQSPGYVRPPSQQEGASIVDDIEVRAQERLEQKYSATIISDILAVAGGTDVEEQLKNIQAQLKSEEKIKEAEEFIKAKEVEWKRRIEELPQKKDIDALRARAEALSFDTKKPLQFAQSLKDAEAIYKELDQKLNLIKTTTADLQSDVATTEKTIKDIENFVREDVADLKRKFKIPSLDPKSFTQGLFMSMLNEKIASTEKYVAVAREYMPTRSKEDRQTLVPRKRGEGQNIRFPITKGYPLFWLKKAAVSSQANTSEFSGNLSGELTNVTSSPRLVGQPAILKLEGDFPSQEIHGFSGEVTVDHTQDSPKESFNFRVASYPLKGLKLIESSDLTFNITQSTPRLSFGGVIEGGNISLAIQNVFRENNYEIDADKKLVKDIFTRVVAGLPEIDLNASFEGSFENFTMSLNSNLGSHLADGFKREIQAEIENKQKEVEAFVQNKVRAQKQKLNSEFANLKDRLMGDLGLRQKSVQDEINKAKAQITKQKSSGGATDGEAPKSGNPLKDAIKDRLKF